MEDLYAVDGGGYFRTYVVEKAVEGNPFIGMAPDTRRPPNYAAVRDLLPRPYWDGHQDSIDAWNRAWEIGIGNLRSPAEGSGFIAPFIDPAFNGHIFLWDSVFMLLFGAYGERAFPFKRTMDNFYARQHPDGFICREIDEATGTEHFHRHDPSSTGPNLLAWFELRSYTATGDRERLEKVFPALVAYHRWTRRYRSWQDGTYFTSGWGCGMDNQPRVPDALSFEFYHGRMSWIDATAQALLSARSIRRIAAILGREAETADMAEEAAALFRVINGAMWDPDAAWYADKFSDGEVSKVKSIASFWTLLAEAVPADRLAAFTAHLADTRSFARPHRPPTLAADAAGYNPAGDYWRGSVWAPTAYMVLVGLRAAGLEDLAQEIACNHHRNVVEVFKATGTFWENYSPERAAPGNLAGKEFVGWTGLSVISVLLEFIFGIDRDYSRGEIRWRLRLPEAHGVDRYPFGPEGSVCLRAKRRTSGPERARVSVESDVDFVLVLDTIDGVERIPVKAPSLLMQRKKEF